MIQMRKIVLVALLWRQFVHIAHEADTGEAAAV